MRDQSNTATDTSIVPEQTLGMGYSDDTQLGTNTFCINANHIVKIGKPISVIGFGSSMNFMQTQKDLGVDISAKIGVDKFSGSFAADYASSIQDTAYSMSYSFVYKIILPTQVIVADQFGPGALNDFGQGAFKEGLDRFKEVCGTKFVVQETSGARLYTTLQVSFDSKYDKSKFAANFQGSIADLGSAVLDIKSAMDKHSISGSIALSAIQEGGDVMRLAKILGKTDDNNILKCALQPSDGNATSPSIDKCQAVVSDILNYAKEDFAEQIYYNSTEEGKIVGVPASIGYSYLLYDAVGIDAQHAGVTNETIAIRQFLGEEDSWCQSVKTYIEKLIYSGPISGLMDPIFTPFASSPNWSGKWNWNPEDLYIEGKAQLQAIYSGVKKVLEAIESPYNGAIQCYKYPDSCKDVNQTVGDVIQSTNLANANNVLTFFNTSYALSTKCDGINYGVRFLLPIGYNNGDGNYLELSNFVSINNTLHNLTNIFSIKETLKNATAHTVLVKLMDASGGFNQCFGCDEAHPGDVVPVYHCTGVQPTCAQALCPELLAQPAAVAVDLFSVDSPV